MALDTITGEQSTVRFKVLNEPTQTRPADFESTALALPELTSSEMSISVNVTNQQATKMYGTNSKAGVVGWDKATPESKSWTMSLSGNVQPNEAERRAMETLIAAHGKYVWIERVTNTDTTKKGGCALVTGTGEPVPADGVVTFSVNLQGWGERFEDISG